MKKICFILFFSIRCISGSFGQRITPDEYVAQYKDMAIREMKRMGVPAAITLAQGILETESGNSELLKKSNNHFGIKCKISWTAGSVNHDDDAVGECFRAYKNAEESYRDHSNFLRGNGRYAFLFKLDAKDYKGWANGLRKAGYATNPHYPDILIKQIETYNLQQFTLEAAGEIPFFDASKYKDDVEIKSITGAQDESNLNPEHIQFAKIIINGSLALFVSKGTSLLAVATENNINLSRLLEMNDLKKDGLLEKGQFVFLEKKQKEGAHNFCVVEPGETLYDIAQKYGILMQSLVDYNNLSPYENIVAGTKLNLKPPVIAVVNNISAPQFNLPFKKQGEIESSNTHEVQPKEGLYSISKKYGVSISQIKEWNTLSDDNIKIGQRLLISK